MEISKLKLAWKYLTGGASGVIDYILDIANNAVNGLQDATKEKIATVLAATKKILATAQAVKWLVPTKWQNAYSLTLVALADVVSSLEDLNLTNEELQNVITEWRAAYSAWRAE